MQRFDDSYFSAMHLILQPDSNNRGAIYLGNIDAAANQETLKALNINAVVTVASGTNLSYPNNFVILYFSNTILGAFSHTSF